jgi:hypothetical protein
LKQGPLPGFCLALRPRPGCRSLFPLLALSVSQPRFDAALLALFAGIALLLAAVLSLVRVGRSLKLSIPARCGHPDFNLQS